MVMPTRPLLPLLLCLLGAGCGGGAGTAAGGRGGPAPAPRPVTLVAAATANLPRTLEVTGTLAPLDELVLGFQVAGRLSELHVDVGAAVAAGAPLAALDRRDFELEVARADAALHQARARLGLPGNGGSDTAGDAVDLETTAPVREAQAVLADARLQRDRMQEMVAENLRSQSDLDAAVAAFEVAQSRVQRARDEVRTWIAELEVRRLDLEVARKRLQDAVIRAPWDGRVAARTAAAGQYLAVGVPVLTLLRSDPLRLRLLVPEQLAGAVAVGQAVAFTVDGLADREHTGTVERLGPAIDRQTRTLLVEAAVPNPQGALRAGGFCRAHIVVDPAQPVVVVPAAAVLSFAGVDRAFTVADGRAREVLVTLGRRLGDRIEVRSGLAAGTEVVADATGLVPGAPVQVGGR